MRRTGPVALSLSVALVIGAPPAAAADPVERWEVRGITLHKEVSVPGTPVEAFDAFTGDVSPWWDHHISENPARLVIDPKPGGTFREIFDAQGNGAIHAEVITGWRGKLLRLRGPLGFTGYALDLVHTFRFEDAQDGSTRVTLELNGTGQIDDEGIAALDRVWDHFLGRYREWVTAGMPADFE